MKENLNDSLFIFIYEKDNYTYIREISYRYYMKMLYNYIQEKLVINNDTKLSKLGNNIYEFFLQFDATKKFKDKVRERIFDFFKSVDSKHDSYLIYVSGKNKDKWTLEEDNINFSYNLVSSNYIGDLYETYKLAVDDDDDAKERIFKLKDSDDLDSDRFVIVTSSDKSAIYIYSFDKHYRNQELIFKKFTA